MKDTKRAEKKIDTVKIKFRTKGDFSFADVLSSSHVDGREYMVRGKDITVNILENEATHIIGLVETTRRFNIPPKKHKGKKEIQSLGLTPEEGLAYANIFVYDKKHKVIMYEVNKNGCYLDHFVEYIYKCCSNKECEYNSMDIKLETVLSVNGYQRIMNMPVKKSIEFKIARPSEIINMYVGKNGAVAENVRNGATLHADKVSAKFEVLMTGVAKHEGKNLAAKPILSTLQQFAELLASPFRNNVEKLEVVGYEEDSEVDKLIPIDLISDRYKKSIKLDEPRDNVDLLQVQRHNEIKKLYIKCKSDFNIMFKGS